MLSLLGEKRKKIWHDRFRFLSWSLLCFIFLFFFIYFDYESEEEKKKSEKRIAGKRKRFAGWSFQKEALVGL